MRYTLLFALTLIALSLNAIDNKGITVTGDAPDGYFRLIENGAPCTILFQGGDLKGVDIAVGNLAADFGRASQSVAPVVSSPDSVKGSPVIVGSIGSPLISSLVKSGKIDGTQLKGKNEKYLMTVVDNPVPGIDKALVIAGSDRRGTIYGVYELSEQLGVSPWYDWADVPVVKVDNLSLKPGVYTAGEPAVKYRGLFLNDEAPCLTGWVKNTYGTEFGDHRFYSRVFELILRLRGNFLWPAMWMWAFYADDPDNSRVADEMGVIMGTSHHEPMARNHQEYARNRSKYGAWNYATNSASLDRFFREGIERVNGTEDVVTLGMRGDGDEAMGEDADVVLLKKIIANQRKIISDVTRRKPSATPQVWALYKEVLDYYDKGLRAPDDVIYLLCDDNWGNLRRVPSKAERRHPGGFGLYYHVDYVGAPRNSKWLNVTPVANMWEQLTLAAQSGIDKMWILNVGDLKPMEYPITLFLDMAWSPDEFTVDNFEKHSRDFCAQAFGETHADEAARILREYSRFNGRVTPEMLDADTYNLSSGEWKSVADDYMRLEAEALRLYLELDETKRDAYCELILFPVQAMANLYDLYYSVAMNHALYKSGDPQANLWADKAEAAFTRDSLLMSRYNHEIAGGKWNGMMTQKHIGYRAWNDDFGPADVMPEVYRIGNPAPGGYIFTAADGVAVMEGPHYYSAVADAPGEWTIIPGLGRTLGGVSVMPYDSAPQNASLTYKFSLPEAVDSVKVHVIVKSTLDFKNKGGFCYDVALDGGEPARVNFNRDLLDTPEFQYTLFYPTVARRVVENVVSLPVADSEATTHSLTLTPLDEGIVFEKIVVDCGGYVPSYLFMDESPRLVSAKPLD